MRDFGAVLRRRRRRKDRGRRCARRGVRRLAASAKRARRWSGARKPRAALAPRALPISARKARARHVDRVGIDVRADVAGDVGSRSARSPFARRRRDRRSPAVDQRRPEPRRRPALNSGISPARISSRRADHQPGGETLRRLPAVERIGVMRHQQQQVVFVEVDVEHGRRGETAQQRGRPAGSAHCVKTMRRLGRPVRKCRSCGFARLGADLPAPAEFLRRPAPIRPSRIGITSGFFSGWPGVGARLLRQVERVGFRLGVIGAARREARRAGLSVPERRIATGRGPSFRRSRR